MHCNAQARGSLTHRLSNNVYFTGYRDIVASIFPLPLSRIVVSRIKHIRQESTWRTDGRSWKRWRCESKTACPPRTLEETGRMAENRKQSRIIRARKHKRIFLRIWNIVGSCFPCSSRKFDSLNRHWSPNAKAVIYTGTKTNNYKWNDKKQRNLVLGWCIWNVRYFLLVNVSTFVIIHLYFI